MNYEILTDEVQKFIEDNLTTDVHKILLSKSKFPKISSKELVEQIESKVKAKSKLPHWFKTEKIYYPNKLNLSQTSSEITANYKASLLYGETIVDVTAGFGVDSYAFSKQIDHVIHIEINKELSTIAKHNFKILFASNIECVLANGISYLKNSPNTYDWLYVDPSRRDKNNKKVYYLSDCEPNVEDHLNLLLSKSDNILIKTGPLLDLKSGLRALTGVKEIHIVALNNDVKEILWIIKKEHKEEPLIKTLNFKGDTLQQFSYYLSEEQKARPTFSKPLTYIYEPNAAILKSGAFQFLSEYYQLSKLHPNSHLYTSDQLIPFPGRIFKIEEIFNYSKKSIKKSGINKANISTRNFPDSVMNIRKKLGIKEGGKNYFFCTTDLDESVIIISTFQI